MNKLVFHVDAAKIPPTDLPNTTHVLLYGTWPPRLGTGSVGGQLERAVKKLGVAVEPKAFDFLAIALAVIAADTFVNRETYSANGWNREIILNIPLAQPELWQRVASDLERALNFLSGDRWKFSFEDGGRERPNEKSIRRHLRSHIDIAAADCICLFSGGMDSFLGARQLVDSGRTPLLVSHSYRGDKQYQNRLLPKLGKTLARFAANANPVFSGLSKNDTTMRTRSLGFIAYGIVAAMALSSQNPALGVVDVLVPENGFIALNVPLTRRRIGSHSTRTTHPNFLAGVQTLLDKVGIGVRLQNPYRHMTKGEMLCSMLPNELVAEASVSTVSCGRWKRKGQQCGYCVPCLIRRAAFLKAGIEDTTSYQYADLQLLWDRADLRDDVMAMLVATGRDKSSVRHRVIANGPLPLDAREREDWFGVHARGLDEVAAYLKTQGVGR